jgi:septum formation protein
MQLILASKSPRRRSLLKTLGLPFRVVPSYVPEHSQERRPEKLVQELALRKARAVAQKVKQGMILGADTVVVLGGEILGQPKDADDAYRMLFRLSGTTHRVYTGVALVDTARRTSKVAFAVSTVRMKPLSIDTLLRLSHKNLDKAGAYAIQNQHDPIARVVKGDYDNVVGLPLAVVKRMLKFYRRAAIGEPRLRREKTLPRRRIPS